MNYNISLKPVNILIIEGNIGDVCLIKQALRQTRIKNIPQVFMDGENAIHYLMEQKNRVRAKVPDLIFLDINLPEKNGLSVLTEIKTDPQLKLVPVIVFSISSAKKDILNAYACYANCYITKPTDFKEFMNMVKIIEKFWFTMALLPGTKK